VSVELTSRERVVYPEAGFTKGDVADYYAAVGGLLLRHLEGRPVTLLRCPEGVDRQGWYQTQCRGRPEWMSTTRIGTQDYCVFTELRDVVWAVNRGAVELHPFLARAAAPDEPTAVVFDLDPGPPADVAACCEVALLLREAAGAAAVAKTSGASGLHVYAPTSERTYAETKALARRVADELAARRPDLVVARKDRALRAGRVLVDWAQNDRTKSLAAAYSLRAMPWPTVSTPVTWDEVERAAAERRPELLTFLPDAVLRRIERFGDLFEPLASLWRRPMR
jgi:bifunctional non-homologous end joining protein LigD